MFCVYWILGDLLQTDTKVWEARRGENANNFEVNFYGLDLYIPGLIVYITMLL